MNMISRLLASALIAISLSACSDGGGTGASSLLPTTNSTMPPTSTIAVPDIAQGTTNQGRLLAAVPTRTHPTQLAAHVRAQLRTSPHPSRTTSPTIGVPANRTLNLNDLTYTANNLDRQGIIHSAFFLNSPCLKCTATQPHKATKRLVKHLLATRH